MISNIRTGRLPEFQILKKNIFRVFSLDSPLLKIRSALFIITLAYTLAYLAHPSTPGNCPGQHPEGWWGWFDQGQYLLSAQSLAEKNLAPANHLYPPLYSALGALFLKWSSGHMFFIINLAALCWFAFVFIRFSDRYFPRWAGLLVFVSTSILDLRIFQNWVIPWTSTLGAALLATGILGLVWMAEVQEGIKERVTGLQAFIVAGGLSLLVPTRPIDAAVGIIIGIGFLVSYLILHKQSPSKVPGPMKFSSMILLGISIGPLIFFGFNFLVFGSPMGEYIRRNSHNGFFPADLPEKFISLWLDGFSLYGASGTGLIEKCPWLLISLAGLVWAGVKGDSMLRWVALAICMLFILYMPYGDLLPNGLWYYLNIHYFKWTFPFLALMGLLLAARTWQAWQQKRNRLLPTALLAGIPLLALSLHLSVHTTSIEAVTSNTSKEISFNLEGKSIDFIDLKGLSGSFTDVYFGRHLLFLDGKALQHVRNYRALPMEWGTRLLFIRSVQGNLLVFIPDSHLTLKDGDSPVALKGTYGFLLAGFCLF